MSEMHQVVHLDGTTILGRIGGLKRGGAFGKLPDDIQSANQGLIKIPSAIEIPNDRLEAHVNKKVRLLASISNFVKG